MWQAYTEITLSIGYHLDYYFLLRYWYCLESKNLSFYILSSLPSIAALIHFFLLLLPNLFLVILHQPWLRERNQIRRHPDPHMLLGVLCHILYISSSSFVVVRIDVFFVRRLPGASDSGMSERHKLGRSDLEAVFKDIVGGGVSACGVDLRYQCLFPRCLTFSSP